MPAAILPAALIGSAALGAGASIYGANKASSAARDAANQNNALQKQIYDQNTANITPWMQRGNAAGANENALLGLGGDTTAANNAFNQYLGSTGYQFQLGQGVNALGSTAASRGLLNSGGNLRNISDYGQNMGRNYFQTYLGNLNGISQTGLSGANALAGVGTGYANAVSANNDSAASAAGNAALTSSGQIANLLGQSAMVYGLKNTGSSYGAGAGGGWASGSGYDTAGLGDIAGMI